MDHGHTTLSRTMLPYRDRHTHAAVTLRIDNERVMTIFTMKTGPGYTRNALGASCIYYEHFLPGPGKKTGPFFSPRCSNQSAMKG